MTHHTDELALLSALAEWRDHHDGLTRAHVRRCVRALRESRRRAWAGFAEVVARAAERRAFQQAAE